MWRLILAALAGLVVLGGVTTCSISERVHGQAQAVQAMREVDTKVAQRSAQRKVQISKHEAKQDEAVQKALEANPDWSNELVPDDILRGLRQ